MKRNYFTILICLLLTLTIFAQEEVTTVDGRKLLLKDDGTYSWIKKKVDKKKDINREKYYIGKHIDDMTDQVYYYPLSRLSYEEDSQGFALSFQFGGKTDKKIKIEGLMLLVVGLGCLEDTKLIFLFEDGSKFNIKSWNKFNCKGYGLFKLKKWQLKSLGSKKIKKIRVENGRNYKSITYTLKNSDKSYLINMYKSFKKKNIIKKQLEN